MAAKLWDSVYLTDVPSPMNRVDHTTGNTARGGRPGGLRRLYVNIYQEFEERIEWATHLIPERLNGLTRLPATEKSDGQRQADGHLRYE